MLINAIKNFFNPPKVDISNRPIPCVDCGACCNYFRVSFNKEENPQVPVEKIVFYKKGEMAMKGANVFKGRCIALTGEIGKNAMCGIYENRPHVCRAFPVWLDNGKQNPRCIKARKFHGLPGEIPY